MIGPCTVNAAPITSRSAPPPRLRSGGSSGLKDLATQSRRVPRPRLVPSTTGRESDGARAAAPASGGRSDQNISEPGPIMKESAEVLLAVNLAFAEVTSLIAAWTADTRAATVEALIAFVMSVFADCRSV